MTFIPFDHKRQQWPVGHGFFHSGSITIPDQTFRYVYDCGSKGRGCPNILKQQIKNYIGGTFAGLDRKEIDLLVLSHFHTDHINGVVLLRQNAHVQTIVVPFLDAELRLASLLQLEVEADSFMEWKSVADVIVDPRMAFNGTRVVEIEADERDESPDLDPVVSNGINIGQRPTYGHQTVFHAHTNKLPYWEFKFYVQKNPKLAVSLIGGILSRLGDASADDFFKRVKAAGGLSLNDWKEIRNEYTSNPAIKGQNAISLCMYAGPVTATQPLIPIRHYLHYANSSYCMNHHHDDDERLGWLGTGDADLHDNGVFSQFCGHYKTQLERIDTMSVPHHGAEGYFHPLLAGFACRYIITGPTNNPNNYHPSDAVLKCLEMNLVDWNIVTGDETTCVFDRFKGVLNIYSP